MPAKSEPVIIKRVKKGHEGHHGGAWKVAYADFVTAMMAFFLLLWLLNSASQEQLEGIADYFAPVSIVRSPTAADGVLAGQAISQQITADLPPPKAGAGQQTSDTRDISEKDAQEVLKQKEQQQFEDAAKEIKEALERLPNLRQLAENLVIDNTPEGLRIQIIDREGIEMFARGSADLNPATRRALELVSRVVQKMPQSISISGHTDATKFAGGERGYTNWELSADRANSTRRALTDFGVPTERLSRVVGSAESDPYIPSNPNDPRNRRIAIVLLRGTGQQGEGGAGTGAGGPAAAPQPALPPQAPAAPRPAPRR